MLDRIPGFLSLPLPFNRRRLAAVKALREYTSSLLDSFASREKLEKGKQGNGECKEEKGDAMLDGNKKQSMKTSDCLASLLLKANEDQKILSRAEIIDNCFGFILAGRGTTSSTLMHICIMLATNQRVQDKARAEVLRVVGERDWESLTLEDFDQNMPYLGATIKEVQRLRPSAPFGAA